MARAAAMLSPITLLVTAAGIIGPTTPLPEVEEEAWDRLFAINVKGTWLALKHVVPLMEEAGGGAIVTFASGAGLVGNPVFPAYAASKGAVVLMTRSLVTGHTAQPQNPKTPKIILNYFKFNYYNNFKKRSLFVLSF
jgi:NAD(P)-dependent dehydrogenase (short-subunit alcohol dehydrogenase family)